MMNARQFLSKYAHMPKEAANLPILFLVEIPYRHRVKSLVQKNSSM